MCNNSKLVLLTSLQRRISVIRVSATGESYIQMHHDKAAEQKHKQRFSSTFQKQSIKSAGSHCKKAHVYLSSLKAQN